MTGRLSELLDALRTAAPAPTPEADLGGARPSDITKSASASAIGGDGSVNYAVGALRYDITIIDSKVGWTVVEEHEVKKIRSKFYVPATRSREQFTKAESNLDCSGITVLEGERGTGKRSDAIRLLSATTHEDAAIYELSPDWEGDQASTKVLPCVSNCRFLLDLTTETYEFTEQFARDLIDYGRALKMVNSQIAVLVTPAMWARCRTVMAEYTVRLIPRDPELIIKAHITFRDSSLRALPWLDDEPLHGLISRMRERQASPEEAVRLAESLLNATTEDLNVIVEAYSKWTEHIGKQLDSRQPGWADRRILLITIAVLNNATSTAIAKAYRKLAASFERDGVALYLALESEGWTARIREIDAYVTDDQTHLNPNKQGLDLAIIEWLWREHPELRQAFLSWIAALLSEPLTRKYADRLADVLVQLVRTFRSMDILERLYSWIKEGKRSQGENRRLAEGTLAALLVDDSAARFTQGRLWQWAYRGSPSAIASLAWLCGGPFGQKYPQVALARLRHLAARADEPHAKRAVGSAFRALVEPESMRFLVVEKMLEWSRDPGAERAGIIGLTALFDSRPDDSVAALLIRHASLDERMLQILRQAWLVLTSNKDQTELVEITRHWSVLRDEGKLHATTVNRLWSAAVEEILMEQPKAAFVEAMTDRTRSEMFMHTVLQIPTIRYEPPPPSGLEFSRPVGRGEPPASATTDRAAEDTPQTEQSNVETKMDDAVT